MEPTTKPEPQSQLLKAAFWLMAPALWFVLYFSYSPIFEGPGWISHDEFTKVYSPDWQPGESKICTTINGNGAGAPEQTKSQQTLTCDDRLPSNAIGAGNPSETVNPVENSSQLEKVRFAGETYLFPKDVTLVLTWICKKNQPGTAPQLTCERSSP
jgi:hypothetical protein